MLKWVEDSGPCPKNDG